MPELGKTYYMRRSMKIVIRSDAMVEPAKLAGHIAKVIEDSGNIAVVRINTGGVVYANPAPKLLEGEITPGKMKG